MSESIHKGRTNVEGFMNNATWVSTMLFVYGAGGLVFAALNELNFAFHNVGITPSLLIHPRYESSVIIILNLCMLGLSQILRDIRAIKNSQLK